MGRLYFMQLFLNYISILVKILLVKLKYLYIQYARISIMKKQNSNQNRQVEKMVELVKTFGHYHHKFQLFQLPVKLLRNLKLKFNQNLITLLIMAICTVLFEKHYTISIYIKRAQEARHNQFFFQNVQTYSNMQNSIAMFTFSVFDWK